MSTTFIEAAPTIAKLTLSPITSGYRANTALNQNFDAIESALENTLSRNGASPNTMESPIDMNGFPLLNLGAPQSDTDAVRLIDLRNVETGGVSVTTAQSMFAKLSDLSSSALPSTTTLVYVGGYGAAGDGGGGLYRRLSGVPSHQSYVTDTLGAIWGLDTTSPTMKQFGAKCDGATDDLAAWNKMLAYGKGFNGIGGTSMVSGSIVLPDNFTGSGGGYTDRVKAMSGFGDIPVFTNSKANATTNGGRNVNITLTNLTVDGNRVSNGGASQTAHGINMQAVAGFTFYGWIENCRGDAIYLGASSTTQTVGCEDIDIHCRSIANMFRQGISVIMVKRAKIQIDYATGCTQQVVDVEPNNSSNTNSDLDIRILKVDTNGSGAFNSSVGLDGSYDNISNVNVYIQYAANQTGQIVSFRGLINGLRIDGVRWDCTNGAGAISQFAGATNSPTDVNIGPIVVVGSGNATTGSGLVQLGAVDTISMSTVFISCGKTGTGVFNCSGTKNFVFTGKIINPSYMGIYLNSSCINTRILNATITGSPDRAVYIATSTYTIITSSDLSNNSYAIYEGSGTDFGTYRNNNCSGTAPRITLVGPNSSQYSNKGIAPPTVSGSRASGAALTNLLALLQTEEIITNGTSA